MFDRVLNTLLETNLMNFELNVLNVVRLRRFGVFFISFALNALRISVVDYFGETQTGIFLPLNSHYNIIPSWDGLILIKIYCASKTVLSLLKVALVTEARIQRSLCCFILTYNINIEVKWEISLENYFYQIFVVFSFFCFACLHYLLKFITQSC